MSTDNMKTNKTIPFIVLLIGTLVMVISFFLPYASATREHREYLEAYADGDYFAEIHMSNKEAVGISLAEYFRGYQYAAKTDFMKTVAIICMVMIIVTAVFTLLCLLFTCFKKPIPVLIFDCLNLGAFYLLSWDFKDRGVIGNSDYHWGIAYYLYYIAIAVTAAGAIWLLVVKINEKKEKKIAANTAK